jgi:hypothetical protein
MSPIKTFPGPPGTDTGDPGAFTNNGCCDALEGMLPDGHEIKNAASNNGIAGILITEAITCLLSVSGVKTLQCRNFFQQKIGCGSESVVAQKKDGSATLPHARFRNLFILAINRKQ